MNFWEKKRREMEAKSGERISQFDLAVKVGVTPSTIGNWLRDSVAPPLSRAVRLAEVFGESRGRIE